MRRFKAMSDPITIRRLYGRRQGHKLRAQLLTEERQRIRYLHGEVAELKQRLTGSEMALGETQRKLANFERSDQV